MMSGHVWIDVEDREDPTKWHTVDKFEKYSITQSVWGDTGTFTLELTPTDDVKSIFLSGEQQVKIICDDALQMTGVTDDRDGGHSVGDGSYLDLTGRDMGRWLIDVAWTEGKSVGGWTLKKLAEYAIAPWSPAYIKEVVTDDAPAHYRMSLRQRTRWRTITTEWGTLKRVKVKGSKQRTGKQSPYYRGVDIDSLRTARIEPGGERLGKLRQVALQVGCMVNVTSRGELFIGRPSYDRTDYDTLVYTNKGGNVLAATWSPSTAERYSKYKVIAQGRKTRSSKGSSNNREVEVIDPSPAFWRTKNDGTLVERVYKPSTILVPKGCHNKKLLRRLARTRVEHVAVNSYGYEVEVKDHARDGVLWAPNACVNVKDDYNKVYGLHYIAARRFIKSINEGTKTILSLIPAEIWLCLDHDKITDEEWSEWITSRITW